MTGPPVHLVALAEPLLRACWSRAARPLSDVLVLADLRRPGQIAAAVLYWGREAVDRAIDAAEAAGWDAVLIPYVMPRAELLSREDFSPLWDRLRAAADDVRQEAPSPCWSSRRRGDGSPPGRRPGSARWSCASSPTRGWGPTETPPLPRPRRSGPMSAACCWNGLPLQQRGATTAERRMWRRSRFIPRRRPPGRARACPRPSGRGSPAPDGRGWWTGRGV